MEFPSSIVNLQNILSIQGQIESFKIEVQGMLAKNHERREAGSSDAYNEQDFYNVAECIRSLSEELMRI